MEGDGEGWTTSGNVQGLPLVLCSGVFLGDDQGTLCSARDRTRIGHIARSAPKPLCYLSKVDLSICEHCAGHRLCERPEWGTNLPHANQLLVIRLRWQRL